MDLADDQPEMDTFEVELVKDQQGLGITIAGYVCEKGKCTHFLVFTEECFTLEHYKTTGAIFRNLICLTNF